MERAHATSITQRPAYVLSRRQDVFRQPHPDLTTPGASSDLLWPVLTRHTDTSTPRLSGVQTYNAPCSAAEPYDSHRLIGEYPEV